MARKHSLTLRESELSEHGFSLRNHVRKDKSSGRVICSDRAKACHDRRLHNEKCLLRYCHTTNKFRQKCKDGRPINQNLACKFGNSLADDLCGVLQFCLSMSGNYGGSEHSLPLWYGRIAYSRNKNILAI